MTKGEDLYIKMIPKLVALANEQTVISCVSIRTMKGVSFGQIKFELSLRDLCRQLATQTWSSEERSALEIKI